MADGDAAPVAQREAAPDQGRAFPFRHIGAGGGDGLTGDRGREGKLTAGVAQTACHLLGDGQRQERRIAVRDGHFCRLAGHDLHFGRGIVGGGRAVVVCQVGVGRLGHGIAVDRNVFQRHAGEALQRNGQRTARR